MSGLWFGRYETLFRIASGGMAEVFAVRGPRDEHGEELAAVKRIAPHLAEDDAFVRMFLDEGRIARQVSSPNVVRTHEFGRADDGTLYIAMELVVGATWAQLVTAAQQHRRPLPVAAVVEMAAQAADGLHDAHEARTPSGEALELVHRDVSPQNFLVDVTGCVKVTDFGIARAQIERYAQSSHGQRKGKLAYFSPEQSRGEPVDRRSDLFSLGIVLWETLARRRLFGGTSYAEKIIELRRAHVPDLHAIDPAVPHGVASVIERALAAAPADRFESAGALARALRSAAEEAGLAGGRAEVADALAHAAVPQIAQLRARLQHALASGDVRTRVDLRVTDPDPDSHGTTLVHSPAADPYADTRVLDPSALPTETVVIPGYERTDPDATRVLRGRRRSRPVARVVALALLALVLLAGASAFLWRC